jgi:hypothetical protein
MRAILEMMARSPNPDRRLRVNKHVRPRCLRAQAAEYNLVYDFLAYGGVVFALCSHGRGRISSLLDTGGPFFGGFQIETRITENSINAVRRYHKQRRLNEIKNWDNNRKRT